METSKLKLDSLEQEHEQLKVDLNFLSSISSSNCSSSLTLAEPTNRITTDYNKAVKQFELNRARLNYLDTTILSLNRSLEEKNELISHLHNEFHHLDSLVEVRLDNNNNGEDIIRGDSSSEESSSVETSSESISNLQFSDLDFLILAILILLIIIRLVPLEMRKLQ